MRGVRLVLGLLLALVWGAASAGVGIVDDAGRTVSRETPAQRIVLTDGMGLIALALIDPDPVARLAGWNQGRLDRGALAALSQELPGLASVPNIGDPERGGSLEALLALQPDLVILDPYYDRSPHQIALLKEAGISVAVLALTPSVRREEPNSGLVRLGTLIGREAEARAYAEFADARIRRIGDRLEGLPVDERPPVLLDAHAGGGACCMSVGKGEGIGDFIDYVGGRSIGAAVIPGMAGMLSPEHIVLSEPQVYIGTGGEYLAGTRGLVVGPQVDAETAHDSLMRVASRSVIPQTPAFAGQRLYGIWHGLAVSAINVVAIEALARWIHPELFADLDPAATLREIEKDFLAAPLTGAVWTEYEARPQETPR